jgi:hypothetical protein
MEPTNKYYKYLVNYAMVDEEGQSTLRYNFPIFLKARRPNTEVDDLVKMALVSVSEYIGCHREDISILSISEQFIRERVLYYDPDGPFGPY